MYFEDLNSLITMGGHGPYVWSAYFLGFAVIAWNLASPFIDRKKTIAEIRRQMRREGRL